MVLGRDEAVGGGAIFDFMIGLSMRERRLCVSRVVFVLREKRIEERVGVRVGVGAEDGVPFARNV